MTNKDAPLMTLNANGIELRVIEQSESPWPFSVQRRISRKTWEQVNAFCTKAEAFTQAAAYFYNNSY